MCNRRRCPHVTRHARTVPAARACSDASAHSTIKVRPERRKLLIFIGTELGDGSDLISFLRDPPASGRNWLTEPSNDPRTMRMARLLRAFTGLSIFGSGTSYELFAATQGVVYQLEISTVRSAFRAALQEPDVGVIYLGHARYGRGACFGPPTFTPGEHWNKGDGETTGIFEMGPDFVAVPADEIVHHEYHAPAADSSHFYTTDPEWTMRINPTEITQEKCDVDLRSHFRDLAMTDIANVQPDLSAWLERSPNEDTFFCYRGRALLANGVHQDDAWHIVLRAGARDLRSIEVQCRFFAHMACGSLPHNAAVFREAAGPAHDDRRHGVWLSEVAIDWAGYLLLYAILNNQSPAAGRSWSSQLQQAVTQANRWLDRVVAGFQLAHA